MSNPANSREMPIVTRKYQEVKHSNPKGHGSSGGGGTAASLELRLAKPDLDGNYLRKALDMLEKQMRVHQCRKFQQGERNQVARWLNEISSRIRDELEVDLPRASEAREQIENAIEKLAAAVDACLAAKRALEALDDDAHEALFARSESDEWGDPEAPLGPDQYDEIIASLKAIHSKLNAAADHALKSPRLCATRPGQPHPAVTGRKQDAWKRSLVAELIGVCVRLGLREIVQQTVDGPLHNISKAVCYGMVGTDLEIGGSAFKAAVAYWQGRESQVGNVRKARASPP